MTALLLFVSTFALVLALGLQSLNVNGGHKVLAALTSFAIGAANLAVLKVMPGDWLAGSGGLPVRRPPGHRRQHGHPPLVGAAVRGTVMSTYTHGAPASRRPAGWKPALPARLEAQS